MGFLCAILVALLGIIIMLIEDSISYNRRMREARREREEMRRIREVENQRLLVRILMEK